MEIDIKLESLANTRPSPVRVIHRRVCTVSKSMCHPICRGSSKLNITINLAEALIESKVLGIIRGGGGHVSRDTFAIGSKSKASRAF